MNRIRKYKSGYQVLTTPHQKYNVGFEFMLGSWTDPGLMGFQVLEFNNYADAECEAHRHPDINWDNLVDFHKDNYYFLRSEIQKVLDHTNMALDFKYHLMTAEEAKNKLFDRVFNSQKKGSFRLTYDMNDIISFEVINPWTDNLEELSKHLTYESRLNIFRKTIKNGVIHLIGKTDIGSTYEIILCTSLMYNWITWRNNNPDIEPSQYDGSLKQILRLQGQVDNSFRLR